jgi:hypothetical protein
MKHRQVFLTAIVVSALLGSPAIAQISEQYDSLSELIYEHGDYDEGNGTFELYSEEPLEFRLSKVSIQGEPEQVTYYENWRAAAYGVYNTFAHTDIESLTVTATPLWIEGFMQRDNPRLLEERSITLAMNREQALDALEAAGGPDSLEAVKTKGGFGYQWSPEFLDVYYEDRQPGLDALIQELREYCVGPCE